MNSNEQQNPPQTIYLDNAATTKPSETVIEAALELLSENYGNPSSPHHIGIEAKTALSKARSRIAKALNADDDEITFTSGGTEANNLAIRGVCEAQPDKKHLIISEVEHPSVYRVCRILKRKGYQLTKIPVSMDGSIDVSLLTESLDDSTALVSMMMVNNETGTILPIQRVVEIVKSSHPSIPVHTDAIQAFGKIPVNVMELGVDLLTISAHKIRGPKGTGALYVKKGLDVLPIVFGGEQENGLRSGTEAMPLIPAFGVAAEEAQAYQKTFASEVSLLRDELIARLRELRGIIVNSDGTGAPHIVNFSAPEKDIDALISSLSERGFCISRGAACKSNHAHGPSMLMSFGLSAEVADSALRVSFSVENTMDEIALFCSCFEELLRDPSL